MVERLVVRAANRPGGGEPERTLTPLDGEQVGDEPDIDAVELRQQRLL